MELYCVWKFNITTDLRCTYMHSQTLKLPRTDLFAVMITGPGSKYDELNFYIVFFVPT